MRQTPRTRKLNENVREAVAFILAEEISDPRLELVTVTGAEVAQDLSIAYIFVIAHGDEERYTEVLEGLNSAKGRIRTLLGKSVPMRVVPELRFEIDRSVDEGMHMNQMLLDVPPTLAARREAGIDDDEVADEAGQ
ncbi:MAG: 30S ribosome-binding factor RbfA [Actinobacteria bacterium]|nr:MAG: 30S ribosome-binding factor RbfA [Actinomycetota bacterium]